MPRTKLQARVDQIKRQLRQEEDAASSRRKATDAVLSTIIGTATVNGITYSMLADACGVTQGTVSNRKRDSTKLTLHEIMQMCDCTGIPYRIAVGPVVLQNKKGE